MTTIPHYQIVTKALQNIASYHCDYNSAMRNKG